MNTISQQETKQLTLTPAQIKQYHEQGYLVVPGLFPTAEVARLLEHYMAMRAAGPKPGDYTVEDKNDPINQFPRMINMHNWDPVTVTASADPGMLAAVKQLIDDEPVLNQTMFYFKPPLTRGQALHQDQQFITIDPLIGVWVAIDDCDKANGQMVVVPGSSKLGLLAVEAADPIQSFTPGQTKMPPGAEIMGVDMKAGDGLFFDGKCIHGSYANVTPDRFRRSFICHYVGAHSKKFEPPKGTHMSYVKKKNMP